MCDWKIGDIVRPTSTAAERFETTNVEPRAQQGWQCPKCGRINAPWVSQCPCSEKEIKVTKYWYTNIPSACRNCSNHPSNGGSGICHCTLGSPKITCGVSSGDGYMTTSVSVGDKLEINMGKDTISSPVYIN